MLRLQTISSTISFSPCDPLSLWNNYVLRWDFPLRHIYIFLHPFDLRHWFLTVALYLATLHQGSWVAQSANTLFCYRVQSHKKIQKFQISSLLLVSKWDTISWSYFGKLELDSCVSKIVSSSEVIPLRILLSSMRLDCISVIPPKTCHLSIPSLYSYFLLMQLFFMCRSSRGTGWSCWIHFWSIWCLKEVTIPQFTMHLEKSSWTPTIIQSTSWPPIHTTTVWW